MNEANASGSNPQPVPAFVPARYFLSWNLGTIKGNILDCGRDTHHTAGTRVRFSQGVFRRPVWASAGTAEDFLTVLLPLRKKFSAEEISDRAIWIFPKAGHRAMLVSIARFFREENPRWPPFCSGEIGLTSPRCWVICLLPHKM